MKTLSLAAVLCALVLQGCVTSMVWDRSQGWGGNIPDENADPKVKKAFEIESRKIQRERASNPNWKPPKRPQYYALLPFAAAADVATFPLQAFFVAGMVITDTHF